MRQEDELAEHVGGERAEARSQRIARHRATRASMSVMRAARTIYSTWRGSSALTGGATSRSRSETGGPRRRVVHRADASSASEQLPAVANALHRCRCPYHTSSLRRLPARRWSAVFAPLRHARQTPWDHEPMRLPGRQQGAGTSTARARKGAGSVDRGHPERWSNGIRGEYWMRLQGSGRSRASPSSPSLHGRWRGHDRAERQQRPQRLVGSASGGASPSAAGGTDKGTVKQSPNSSSRSRAASSRRRSRSSTASGWPSRIKEAKPVATPSRSRRSPCSTTRSTARTTRSRAPSTTLDRVRSRTSVAVIGPPELARSLKTRTRSATRAAPSAARRTPTRP